MDGFDSVIFVWFASAMLVTAIGYFLVRLPMLMTVGVLLGPIAVVMTVVLVVARLLFAQRISPDFEDYRR